MPTPALGRPSAAATTSSSWEPPSGRSWLAWSIKDSFLRYIFGLPDGRCSVAGGVDVTQHSEFVFAQQEEAVPEGWPHGRGELRFRGEVRFTGHFGLLSVRIAEPSLHVAGGSGAVTILSGSTPAGGSSRSSLATFDVHEAPAPGRLLRGVNVRLTPSGSDLFGGVYPAGEELSPLSVVLDAAG